MNLLRLFFLSMTRAQEKNAKRSERVKNERFPFSNFLLLFYTDIASHIHLGGLECFYENWKWEKVQQRSSRSHVGSKQRWTNGKMENQKTEINLKCVLWFKHFVWMTNQWRMQTTRNMRSRSTISSSTHVLCVRPFDILEANGADQAHSAFIYSLNFWIHQGAANPVLSATACDI